jgi:hypothetical protein
MSSGKQQSILRRLRINAGIIRRDIRNRLRYGVDAPKAYQLMYCRPRDIRYHSAYVSSSLPDDCATVVRAMARDLRELRHHLLSVVADGDWDLPRVPLANVPPFRITMEKLASGLSWEEGGEYDRMRAIIAVQGWCDGCETTEDLDHRYRLMDAMISHIEVHRQLKTQRELPEYRFREMGGINVCIDRHGEIIKLEEGTHRLAVACHFDLPAVPVCVRLVHVDCVRSGRFRELMAESRRLEASLAKG